MAPPKKRALPKPLPEGFILTDTDKKEWRLGKIIGQGGFGLIYLGTHTPCTFTLCHCAACMQTSRMTPCVFLLDTH